jgi:hypothetical protein
MCAAIGDFRVTLWERDFLKIAAVWLSCRLNVMGLDVTDSRGRIVYRGAHDYRTLQFALLGDIDHVCEMRLMCELKPTPQSPLGTRSTDPIPAATPEP